MKYPYIKLATKFSKILLIQFVIFMISCCKKGVKYELSRDRLNCQSHLLTAIISIEAVFKTPLEYILYLDPYLMVN